MVGLEQADALGASEEQAEVAGLLVAHNVDDPISLVVANTVVQRRNV
jgi:hypothetical protein